MTSTNTKTITITTSIVAVAIAIAFSAFYLSPSTSPSIPASTCLQNQILVDGQCLQGTIEPGTKIIDEITNANVIDMRTLRIDDLLNKLNALPDSDFKDPIKGRDSYSKSLASIKDDTQKESVVTAFNNMYNLQKQFDGMRNDELLSNPQSTTTINALISDIMHSQYKSLSISSSTPFPDVSKSPMISSTPFPYVSKSPMISPAPIGPKTIDVKIPSGTSSPGCEEKKSCFNPYSVIIDKGSKITWTNTDTAAHTVTSGDPTDGPSGTFDSSLIPSGKSFEFTFTDSGSYNYFCMVHPWMTGNIQVN